MHRFLVATVVARLVLAPEVATAQELSEVAAFRTLFVPSTTLDTDDATPVIQAPGLSQNDPPIPHRTGFRALAHETGADFVSFPRRTSTWQPVVYVDIADEWTKMAVGDLDRPRMTAMGRCDATIAVSRRRAALMSTNNVARTGARRPCSPRGVPTPIR